METVTKNSDIENRHQFGNSSHRSLPEVRRSLSGLNSRVSRQRPDTKRVKRVRFAETEADCPVISKPLPYALPAKEALPPTFVEPKTSEYAFYKKLRKDAGGSFNSYTRNKQDIPVEKFEANNPVGELSSTRNPVKSDVLRRSLMPVAMVTPIKFISPQLSRPSLPEESKNSGAQNRSVEVFAEKRQKLLQWALESSCRDISWCHSNRSDLVSVLLQRLIPESNETASMTSATQKTKHQMLATESQLLSLEELTESSSPHVNLVPPFAKQYIENGLSNWSNQFRETIFTQMDAEDSGSPLIQQANKFHPKCRMKYLDDFTDDKRLGSLKRMRELDFDLDLTDDRKRRSLPKVGEFDFDIDYLNRKESFSGCGHLAPNQSRSDFSIHGNLHSFWDFSEKPLGFSNKSSSEELDEPNDLSEPRLINEQHSHLLGYHDYDSRNEHDFSCYSPSTVLNLSPTSITLSGDYNWSTPNPKFGTTELKSSSVLAICEDPDFPLLESYSESYPLPGLGSQVNDKRNYQVAILDHFPPMNKSLNSPHYLSLAENIKLSGDHINRIILNSPCGNIRFMSMGFRDSTSPNAENLRLLPGVDFNCEMKGLSAISSFEEYPTSQSDLQLVTKDIKGLYSSSHMGATNDMFLEGLSQEASFCHNDEDIFSTHDYSPIGFKFSLKKEMVYQMLLDKSSWNH